MRDRFLSFLREVDAIEIALIFNALAWANYFAAPPSSIPSAFYRQMTDTLTASFWASGAYTLFVLQIVAIISRKHKIRNFMLVIHISAGCFTQVTLYGLAIVTIVVPLNAGLIVATLYALLSRTVRHDTIRVG